MDYPVGYKKPPKDTQFKPGESGNPKGRGKGHRNVSTIIDKISKERVMISENGKQRSIAKNELLLHQLFNSGLKGNLGALKQLLPLLHKLEEDATMREQHSALNLTPERLETLRERLSVSLDTLIPEPKDEETPSEGGSDAGE